MGKNILQQKFIYGESGIRLLGLGNTEAYSLSVKSAENVLITPIGSLRSAPKFNNISYENLDEDVLEIRDTNFKYSFIITANKLYTIEKSTLTIKAMVEHKVANPVIFNTFENFCVIGNLTITEIFQVNKETGALGISDFFNSIKKPLRFKKVFQGELYKWLIIKEYDIASSSTKDVKKLVKVQTYKDPNGFGTDSEGKLLINGASKAIARIYCIASTDLSEKLYDVTEFSEGDYIFNFHTGVPENVVINNTAVTLIGTATDKKGQVYYTSLNEKSIPSGDACIGQIIKIDKNEVKDICVFQNRLCMATGTELFFSEMFNYTNFLGDEKTSGAFYIKPSPIKSVQPNIRKIAGNRGLWVNTDRGFYVLGFNNQLSENDCFMQTASDKIPSLEQVLIGEVIYFIDVKGVAYNIQNIGETILKFVAIELDKFDIKRNSKYVSSLTIDGTEYVVIVDKLQSNKVYLYRPITDNIFSRISLLIENSGKKMVGWYDNYFLGNKLFIQTDNFVSNVKIGVLPPYMSTSENGLYLNNDTINVTRVVLKVLNEDNQAIEKININGTEISNIEVDVYNTYVCNDYFQIENGFDIEIELKGNDKVFELLGIEQTVE
mgnify:CR=1 FL=1